MRNAGIVWRAFCAAILLLAGIFAFLVLATAPSKSQNAPGMQRTLTVQCGPFPLVMRQLTEKYGEAVRSNGTMGQTQVMQTYVSPSGSWTVIITDTRGLSCIVAAGQDWQSVAAAPIIPGRDS